MYTIDKLLLAPYWISLRIRHAMYDKGLRKSSRTAIPAIAIGNVSAGGTGKTPHTEMILRMLTRELGFEPSEVAVLSRGYKRKSRGFQQVTVAGSVDEYGDEPLQIKRKFPDVTVAVDKDRLKGAALLAHPEKIGADRHSRKCADKNMAPARIVVLDDALQYRKLRPDLSIMLVDWNKPTFKDHLLPIGRLRDLPLRIKSADIVIVTKCPPYIEEEDKLSWRKKLGLKDSQELFFTSIGYCRMEPVFPEGEPRYIYSKRLVLFTGIANDSPLLNWLSCEYQIMDHIKYPDHHRFSRMDIHEIQNAANAWPTSIVATTEKDSQRVRDVKKVPEILRKRMFRVPVEALFIGDGERERFATILADRLNEYRSESEPKPRE